MEVGDPNATAAPDDLSDHDIFYIETYLRQCADHPTMLAIDALVLREDLAADVKAARLRETIQGAFDER
ncbi:MAG: hypothetical protein JWL65_2227 [Gammaproteobacteria bacterium]|nr:hypothetical protein [Gammaproteobacteria bacterium]